MKYFFLIVLILILLLIPKEEKIKEKNIIPTQTIRVEKIVKKRSKITKEKSQKPKKIIAYKQTLLWNEKMEITLFESEFARDFNYLIVLEPKGDYYLEDNILFYEGINQNDSFSFKILDESRESNVATINIKENLKFKLLPVLNDHFESLELGEVVNLEDLFPKANHLSYFISQDFNYFKGEAPHIIFYAEEIGEHCLEYFVSNGKDNSNIAYICFQVLPMMKL